MEFLVKSSRKQTEALGSKSITHGSTLSMYKEHPSEEIALEEFEQFALDRLKVLKLLEEARNKGKKLEELDELVDDGWRKHMRTANSCDLSRKDEISHFILRIAYCRNEQLRKHFVNQETSLFRHRFRVLSPELHKKFLETSNFPYKAMDLSEYNMLKDTLNVVVRSYNPSASNLGNVFYKVPFEEVPELVSNRKVFLKKGNAFVGKDQLVIILANHFKNELTKALITMNRKWVATIAEQEKNRLTPVIESLSNHYFGKDYMQGDTTEEISINNLQNLAVNSFPPCMKNLYFKLKENSHLKHQGRIQLGLFLKGIGLRLEDALVFWKSEFTKKMTSEKFDKEYSYNIRHNYGQEGKRTNYTPLNCQTIIKKTPGVGEFHGCPFRHFDHDKLYEMLNSCSISSSSINEIMYKSRNHHYQLACTSFFESKHDLPNSDISINHPNEYFEESRKIIKAKETSQGNDV